MDKVIAVKAHCLVFRGKLDPNTVRRTPLGIKITLEQANSMAIRMSSPGRKGDSYSRLKGGVWIVPDSEYQRLIKAAQS